MTHAGTSIQFRTAAALYRFCLMGAVLFWGCTNATENGDTDVDSTHPNDRDTVDTAVDTETESGRIAPPACLDEIDSSLADADADDLFYVDHVPIFDIYLPADEWDDLQENAQAELYTEARACFDGRGIGTVGLRFKGSYGTLYGCFEDGELVCPRLSMKLKFDKYVEAQRFFGLKRLNFHANRYDDSMMKERLAYDLYRAMGIASPRASWAVVRVNGESYGLYGMVEQIDGRFTNDRWPDYPDGNLYKELWPTDTDESFVIDQLRTNEEVADVSSFLAFSEAFVDAEDAAKLSTLGEFSDLDHLARYMAVDEAVLSYDGVTYFWSDGGEGHNHNYYIYEDAPGHFALIPWDVESTFWINPNHAPPHWTEIPEDCSLTYPYWGGLATAPGCDTVFQALGSDLSLFKSAAEELLDGPFALETMLEKIETYAEFIREDARDPATPTMYGTFDGAVSSVKSVIPELRERLEGLIAEAE